jgi:release factor glutamine methyltransferase
VNCRQALDYARKAIENSRIPDASLEGEILVRYITGLDRAALFANLDKELDSREFLQYSILLKHRLNGEPSAYITGHKEFYGKDFYVDPRVLIPRPETELLVEKTIEMVRRYRYSSIADIGTGSGCIAVTLAKELPRTKIIATDLSPYAVEIAAQNIKSHGLTGKIKLLQGNLLEPLPKSVDIIVANLPYVKKADAALPYEPKIALNGGEDGLDIIREIIKQAPGKLKKRGALLLEIGLGQSDEVKNLLTKAFPGSIVEVHKDLAGIDRIVVVRLTA